MCPATAPYEDYKEEFDKAFYDTTVNEQIKAG